MPDNLKANDEMLPDSFEEREALEKKRYKLAKKQDVFIILGIIVMALGFWIYSQFSGGGQNLYVDVFYFNQRIDRISLTPNNEGTYTYDQHPAFVVQVNANGTVQVASSDCPDQICVNGGAIGNTESFLACVPNGFLISIHAEEDPIQEEVDIVN